MSTVCILYDVIIYMYIFCFLSLLIVGSHWQSQCIPVTCVLNLQAHLSFYTIGYDGTSEDQAVFQVPPKSNLYTTYVQYHTQQKMPTLSNVHYNVYILI